MPCWNGFYFHSLILAWWKLISSDTLLHPLASSISLKFVNQNKIFCLRDDFHSCTEFAAKKKSNGFAGNIRRRMCLSWFRRSLFVRVYEFFFCYPLRTHHFFPDESSFSWISIASKLYQFPADYLNDNKCDWWISRLVHIMSTWIIYRAKCQKLMNITETWMQVREAWLNVNHVPAV